MPPSRSAGAWLTHNIGTPAYPSWSAGVLAYNCQKRVRCHAREKSRIAARGFRDSRFDRIFGRGANGGQPYSVRRVQMPPEKRWWASNGITLGSALSACTSACSPEYPWDLTGRRHPREKLSAAQGSTGSKAPRSWQLASAIMRGVPSSTRSMALREILRGGHRIVPVQQSVLPNVRRQ